MPTFCVEASHHAERVVGEKPPRVEGGAQQPRRGRGGHLLAVRVLVLRQSRRQDSLKRDDVWKATSRCQNWAPSTVTKKEDVNKLIHFILFFCCYLLFTGGKASTDFLIEFRIPCSFWCTRRRSQSHHRRWRLLFLRWSRTARIFAPTERFSPARRRRRSLQGGPDR